MYKYNCSVSVDSEGRQIESQGTFAYPTVCYLDDLKKFNVMFHWHDELEVIIAHKGNIVVSVGQNKKIVTEGNGCFINSGVVHAVYDSDTNESLLHSIVFHPRLIGSRDSIYWQKYIQPIIGNKFLQFVHFNQSREKDNQIINLIKKAWEAEANETAGHEFEVRSMLSQMIFLLFEGKIGKSQIPTNKELRDMERMKLMLAFIESNFANNITISEIAKTALISESECMRCFHRTTGTSPIKFLNEYRILYATELLKSTQLKISEIAVKCGFLDMSYFAKTFKLMIEMSPTKYRETYHKLKNEQRSLLEA